MDKKQFIVRKYVLATSAAQAIRLEKHIKVDDVWIDDEWAKNNPKNIIKNVGFNK